MRFRKLRIAFSAACGLAFVLLAALWVRSYWREDFLFFSPLPHQWRAQFSSSEGQLHLIAHGEESKPTRWSWQSNSIYDSFRREWWWANLHDPDADRAFYFCKLVLPPGFVGQAPHWFFLLMLAVIAVAPWVRQGRWHFSLRTLLIATSLVAMLLGLIVWLNHHQ